MIQDDIRMGWTALQEIYHMIKSNRLRALPAYLKIPVSCAVFVLPIFVVKGLTLIVGLFFGGNSV